MDALKRSTFDEFLSEGWVFVHVQSDAPGVKLGPSAKVPVLILLYGNDLPLPIPDLKSTEEGIAATLSFKGVDCKTFVPWSAVTVIGKHDRSAMLSFNADAVAAVREKRWERLKEAVAITPERIRELRLAAEAEATKPKLVGLEGGRKKGCPMTPRKRTKPFLLIQGGRSK